MSRLNAVPNGDADSKTRAMLEAVQAKLKITPNMVRVMANSPAVLEGYLSFSGALAGGSLHAGLREAIALAVGEQNRCQYCVSAHSVLGKLAGLTDQQITQAREGHAESRKDQAALEFVRHLVANRGQVSEADFDGLRTAGLTNAEIAEVIAHTALNIFTNYFNTAAGVDVDFPKIALREAA